MEITVTDGFNPFVSGRWVHCTGCEKIWCNEHEMHAGICPCPDLGSLPPMSGEVFVEDARLTSLPTPVQSDLRESVLPSSMPKLSKIESYLHWGRVIRGRFHA